MRNLSLSTLPQLGGVGKLLIDKTSKGRQRPWKLYRQGSNFLAEAYWDLGQEKRSERVGNCATYLKFLECQSSENHPKKLAAGYFCGDRLCPQCQERRSARQFAASIKLGHELLRRHPTYKFVFLTLTVPNVKLERLGNAITHIFESWQRLTQRNEVRQAIRGYLRTLEVTYNHERDDWHPHIHAALVVPSRYFKTEDYIPHARWLQMWQEATRMPQITQVDIRKVKPSQEGVDPLILCFAELSKYSVKEWSTAGKQTARKLMKSKSGLTRDVEGHAWLRKTREETAAVVEKLQAALHKRRLVQVGGILRDIKHELGIKDGEDEGADLVNTKDEKTGCQCSICGGTMKEVYYIWREALGNYYC